MLGTISALTLLAANGIAWAASSDWGIGGFTTGTTAFALVAVGVIAYALQRLGSVWNAIQQDRRQMELNFNAEQERLAIRLRAEREAADRESLTAMINDLRATLQETTDELKAVRAQREADQDQHREQVDLLMKQVRQTNRLYSRTLSDLERTNSELIQARDNQARMLDRLDRVHGQVARNSMEIGKLAEAATETPAIAAVPMIPVVLAQPAHEDPPDPPRDPPAEPIRPAE